MSSFACVRPETIEEALDYLNRYRGRARIYAGGTDLLVKIKNGGEAPQLVVDISRVAELDYIEVQPQEHIRIGAATTFSRLLAHSAVQSSLIALREAISVIGSVQIRNLATVGGNLCNASPAADSAPPLVVYGASVNIIGSSGSRTVPVEDFFTGPGSADIREGELLESLLIPLDRNIVGSSFHRFGRRKAVELATVSSAVSLSENNEVRVCLGAVGKTPLRAAATENRLSAALRKGIRKPEKAFFAELEHEIDPISDVRASGDYRRALARTLTERAFADALWRAQRGTKGRES